MARALFVFLLASLLFVVACSDDDNGNNNNNNNAPTDCGDGIVDPGEQCDDGTANSDASPDACRTDCRDAYCGDGVLDSGELCDTGAANSDTDADACRTTCVPASCGDSTTDATEICDDGNQTSGDGCSGDCLSDESCGNAIQDDAAGEQCDCGTDAGNLPAGCDTSIDDIESQCTNACMDLCAWSNYYGIDHQWAQAHAVTTDNAGNFIITGQVRDFVNLGGSLLGNGWVEPVIIVAKYDASGNHLWSRHLGAELTSGNPGRSVGRGVVVDSNGDVFVMGEFGEEMFLDGTTITPWGPAGAVGTVVVKLDGTDGSVLDFAQLGGTNATGDRLGWSIAIDGSDNLVIAGSYTGFWNCSVRVCVDLYPGNEVFVVKLDPTLAVLWNRFASDDYDDVARAVAVDSAGDVFVTGQFSSTINLGTGWVLDGGNNNQMFAYVAKLSGADGTTVWAKMLGTLDVAGVHMGHGLATLSTGAVVVTGTYRETLTLSPSEAAYSPNIDQMFLVAYDGDGVYQWHTTAGVTQAGGAGVAANANDDVVVIGNFVGDIDLGGGPHSTLGADRLFLARYDSSGGYLGSRVFGSTGSNTGLGVAVDPGGRIALTGYSVGNIDFGCAVHVYASSGDHFPFVALLNPF